MSNAADGSGKMEMGNEWIVGLSNVKVIGDLDKSSLSRVEWAKTFRSRF